MSSEKIWGLKKWLQAMNLTQYYKKLKTMNYTQLLSLTKSELGKLCTPEDVLILGDSIEIANAELGLISQLRNAYVKGCGVYFMLQQLEYILPSQFEPVLGRVSSRFVGFLELVNCALQEIKSKPMKIKCMRLFCKHCFHGEQSEYFRVEDKETLKTMRLQYQEEARQPKKN